MKALSPDNETQSHTHGQFFKKIAGGFGLVSLLLIATIAVSYQSLIELVDTNKQVTRTQERLNKIEALLSQMKDAETGQRGYIITAKESYLEPYNTATKTIKQKIEELKKLTVDNSNEQRHLDTLKLLIEAKLAELKRTIYLRSQKRFALALQVIQTNQGKNLMDDIRAHIRKMENEENRLLNQQIATAESHSHYTFVLLLTGIFLNFVILSTVYYLICREITERKRAESALQIQRQWLEVTLSSIGDAVIATDTTAAVTFMNPVAETLTGWPVQEALGRKIEEIFLIINEQTRQTVTVPVEQALREGIVVELAERTALIARNGKEIPIDDSVAPICLTDQPLQGAVLVFRDSTKHRKAEAEITSALVKEKELNELKSRFISMASHEFRTPLTAILLSSELLKNYGHKWSEEKKLKHMHRIQSSVKHMSNLLEDLLLIGKVEAGKIEFNPTVLNLEEFCRSIVEELKMIYEEHHNLNFVAVGNVTHVQMDEKLLRQILTNLLSNAIKYSPEGSTVNFELLCYEKETSFQIKDTGIGIPQEDLQRLFESFHRASNVGTIAGTGLGLAIVKRCVDLHGGQIEVESEVGVGTTVTVTLPSNSSEVLH